MLKYLLASSAFLQIQRTRPAERTMPLGARWMTRSWGWATKICSRHSVDQNPNLPSTARQIRNYLAAVNGQANPNALYLIGSGANDAFVAEQLFPAKDRATAFLVGEAGVLVNSISQLKAAGGRYIVVTDEYVPPSADATAVAYVKTLGAATWGGLAAAGVNFIPADTLSVIAVVEQNPLAFGITAPITRMRASSPQRFPSPGVMGFCAHRRRYLARITGIWFRPMRRGPISSWMARISRKRAR